MRASAQIILYLLFVTTSLRAQELLPFVENFTKSEYHGDNQNWNITQGSDRAMYFANNHFLLRYNGVKWEKYMMPNKTIIRAVKSIGDKIYCGSYKEFGYWKRLDGKMKYFSLSSGKNLFSGQSANEEIWKIFAKDGRIYFQSFNELFIHDNSGIQKLRFPAQISYCYVVDNQIYAASVRDGIYVMLGNKFVKKQHWSAIDDNVIHHIEKHQGKIYIFTKSSGIFVEQNNELTEWNHLLNNALKREVILTAKFVSDTMLAIGTAQKGLYLVNLADSSYQCINRNNAIRNNAVLSIFEDAENDLWLGLDNGIAHVEINSSIEVFLDNSGVLGSVYALSTTDDGYIFVTNHGVFEYRNGQLEAVPDSQGQVWDILKLGNEFVIGHNDGTFLYDTKDLRKVNSISGGWKFLKSDFDNALFQAHYSGVVYYKNNDLTNPIALEGLTKPIRNIVQNKPRELWAADNYRSLYRITYDADFKTKKVENVSQANGLTNDFGVKLFCYKNEILFLINKVWYAYDAISGKLEKEEVFNASFPSITDIMPIDDTHFLILDAGLLYVVTQVNNEFVWELIPQKYYEGKLILEDSRIYKRGNKIFLNLDDGFLSYTLNGNKSEIPKFTVEGFYRGRMISRNTQIKYNQPVEINVLSGHYGYKQQDFFYTLNGSTDYIRIRGGNLTLNNLNSGNQHLEFYYFNGRKFVRAGEFRFDVDNPWYFSMWMLLVYFLLISGSFYLYYKWNKLRYNQKLQLKEEELRHQQKILELELKAENELNLQEYEKHILELEVQSKSSEVAGKSLSIAKQGEMIDNIKQILEQETDINRLKTEVLKAIKINSVNKHEWEVFENNLSQIHDGFIQTLSTKYPQLTSKDIKLCIYLKMNLSSKEIAPLMNISFRGVELHRYRLRKKLGLSQDENLYKVMLAI